MTKQDKVLALVRVSTDEQDLRRQEDAAAAWAGAQGIELEIVRENGVSGAAKKRPGLDRILAEARAGRVSAVWVLELSRLGRSLVRVVQVLHELDALGVRVVVANAGIDYGSPAGRLQAQIIASFAEYERELIRERTLSGLAAARAKGKRLGGRPDRWDEAADVELRTCVAEGLSLSKIIDSGRLWIQRPVLDAKSGEWTDKPVHPGRTKIQARIKALRLR